MIFKTPIEEFVPELQSVIKEFIRKARAPNLELMGNIPKHYSHDVARFTQAAFKDPRFPQLDEFVGSITWNEGENEWTVQSRTVQNQKYRNGSIDRKRKKTKDFTKAVKMSVTHITPFTYREVMSRSDGVASVAIREWRQEGNKFSNTFSRMSYKSLYEEVKRLRDMGVAFITPEFQKIADEGLALYELSLERKNKYVRKHHVLFIEHGRIAVTVQDVDTNDFNDAFHGSKVYESFEQLPEEIATNVAMLKMLSDKDGISGLGVRVSANEYFVFVPLDSNAKA